MVEKVVGGMRAWTNLKLGERALLRGLKSLLLQQRCWKGIGIRVDKEERSKVADACHSARNA